MKIQLTKLVINRKIFILFIMSLFFYSLKKPFVSNNINLASNTYRIAFVFGTRPEVIKLIPLIRKIKENKMFSCITINTGQHKEMIQQILKSFKMEKLINFNLDIMEKNQSLAKMTSKILLELDKIYSIINPHAIIVQGDTTTGYAASICGFYLKIPIFHVEAGLRTHNLFSPFPEEFNRKSIDIISNLYFASTDWAANNLLKENINSENIFVTGNTVVDSLFLTLNNTSPSNYLQKIILNSQELCTSKNDCKIILVTFHRRENYNSVSNILIAIFQLLKENCNIIIFFPFHLNPNIRQAIQKEIPEDIYRDLIKLKKINNNQYLYLNRFLLIPPLDYIDLIHLQSTSYFIMTDSGGIQEEGVSIGKPILILRNTTERPEAIESGSAILVGTSPFNIYYFAKKLINDKKFYNKMAKAHFVFGRGNSSDIIFEIIQNYFKNYESNYSNISKYLNKFNYSQILSNYDKLESVNMNESNYTHIYDGVIVLTVWKRNNLEKQIKQVNRQTIIKKNKINLIVFQNSAHIDITGIINKWKENLLANNIILSHIQSPIETGYYGRFLVPLTSHVTNNAFFIICDDDVIWGDRYFENMLRLVNEGSLATRNGRIISWAFRSTNKAYNLSSKKHICYDEDIEFDYGGHLWAGKIDWLRKAWTHIPISIENSEDFWLSSVLKSFYNISTKIPKCPCPKDNNLIIPEFCAVSDVSARHHIDAKFGNLSSSHELRTTLIKKMSIKYNFTRLISVKPEYVRNIHKKYVYGNNRPLFNLSDDLWKGALYWQ